MILAVVFASTCIGQTHLVFYRLNLQEAEGFARASIKIDGDKPTYKIASNRIWTVDVATGRHTIYGDRKQFLQTYEFENGRTYYFRLQFMTGTLRPGFRVIQVPEELGKSESFGLKR
jgi:hypothetical protein